MVVDPQSTVDAGAKWLSTDNSHCFPLKPAGLYALGKPHSLGVEKRHDEAAGKPIRERGCCHDRIRGKKRFPQNSWVGRSCAHGRGNADWVLARFDGICGSIAR